MIRKKEKGRDALAVGLGCLFYEVSSEVLTRSQDLSSFFRTGTEHFEAHILCLPSSTWLSSWRTRYLRLARPWTSPYLLHAEEFCLLTRTTDDRHQNPGLDGTPDEKMDSFAKQSLDLQRGELLQDGTGHEPMASTSKPSSSISPLANGTAVEAVGAPTTEPMLTAGNGSLLPIRPHVEG